MRERVAARAPRALHRTHVHTCGWLSFVLPPLPTDAAHQRSGALHTHTCAGAWRAQAMRPTLSAQPWRGAQEVTGDDQGSLRMFRTPDGSETLPAGLYRIRYTGGCFNPGTYPWFVSTGMLPHRAPFSGG